MVQEVEERREGGGQVPKDTHIKQWAEVGPVRGLGGMAGEVRGQ